MKDTDGDTGQLRGWSSGMTEERHQTGGTAEEALDRSTERDQRPSYPKDDLNHGRGTDLDEGMRARTATPEVMQSNKGTGDANSQTRTTPVDGMDWRSKQRFSTQRDPPPLSMPQPSTTMHGNKGEGTHVRHRTNEHARGARSRTGDMRNSILHTQRLRRQKNVRLERRHRRRAGAGEEAGVPGARHSRRRCARKHREMATPL